jgi:hypothetical protein
MKLCAPMVEAMGGSDSPYYRHFRTYCCEAYNILRKSATLILSLFHLMAGAAIPDVRQDPEKAMLKLQVNHGCHVQLKVLINKENRNCVLQLSQPFWQHSDIVQ